MTEPNAFTTREERDAFENFCPYGDRSGNSIRDRMAGAWNAARKFWVPDRGPTFPPRPNLGLARNEELFGELKARLGMGHTNPKYATVFPSDDGAALDSDPEWFLKKAKQLVSGLVSIEGVYEQEPDFADIIETIKETGGSVEIAGVKIQPCDEYGRTEPTEVTDTGLSEFGRGYEEGKAEASDRQLRLAALQHATQLALAGQIYVKGSQGREGESKYVSFPHPVETAVAMLHFLEGGA